MNLIVGIEIQLKVSKLLRGGGTENFGQLVIMQSGNVQMIQFMVNINTRAFLFLTFFQVQFGYKNLSLFKMVYP